MTFYTQGLNGHELMSVSRVFKGPAVGKTKEIAPAPAIDEKKHQADKGEHGQQHLAAQAYQAIKQLPQTQAVLLAEQIMNSPVVTLTSQATLGEALTLFREKQFRHLPVVSSAGLLIGIVSDRDILRDLSGVTESYQRQARRTKGDRIDRLMKSPVLTASMDTDVRYIARLFVEQRIGALPIVSHGELQGLITRSDVLNAVMRHFVLELWA